MGLALVAGCAALVMCEAGARLILPPPPEPWREPQVLYRTDPELRYVFEPSQEGWIDEGLVTINALGFRGPAVTTPKPAGRFRVAALGDSVTLGWGVGDTESFPAIVEQRLRAERRSVEADVANLAVAGYNTRQEVSLLERYLESLQPDVVLLGFYANDLADALDDAPGSQRGGTRVSADTSSSRTLRMNPTPDTWINRAARRSRLVYALGRVINRALGRGEWSLAKFTVEIDMLNGRDTPDLRRAWTLVEEQFARLRALADTRGFRVAVVVLPSKEQVTGQFTSASYQTRVRELAERSGFLVVDPLPDLMAATERARLFIPYDRNHPSAYGHRIIGDVVGRAILAWASSPPPHTDR